MHFKIRRIFNILVGILFITIGIIQLFNAQTIQYNFVDLGLTNWFFSTFFYWIVVSLELSFGFLLLIQKDSKYTASVFALTIFYILIQTITSEAKSSFLFKYNDWPNILLLIFMITIITSHLIRTKVNKIKWWAMAILITVNLGISFAFNPIYVEDYTANIKLTDINKKIESDLVIYLNEKGVLNEKFIFVSFLSSNCPTCIETAKKINVTNSVKEDTKFIFIFSDTEENVDNFMSYLEIRNIETLNIPKGKFLYLCQSRTPVSYLIEKQNVIKRWAGNQLRYKDLDQLD